ncbi:MAG: hypothetical protein LBT40_00490 [Deltaproteobacteria bacterium]|nr:hypothetical protein [Deltaproteobacteria bacterium]
MSDRVGLDDGHHSLGGVFAGTPGDSGAGAETPGTEPLGPLPQAAGGSGGDGDGGGRRPSIPFHGEFWREPVRSGSRPGLGGGGLDSSVPGFPEGFWETDDGVPVRPFFPQPVQKEIDSLLEDYRFLRSYERLQGANGWRGDSADLVFAGFLAERRWRLIKGLSPELRCWADPVHLLWKEDEERRRLLLEGVADRDAARVAAGLP